MSTQERHAESGRTAAPGFEGSGGGRPATFLQDVPFLSSFRWRCASLGFWLGWRLHPLFWKEGRKWGFSQPLAVLEAGKCRAGRRGVSSAFPAPWEEQGAGKNLQVWQLGAPHRSGLPSCMLWGFQTFPSALGHSDGTWGQRGLLQPLGGGTESLGPCAGGDFNLEVNSSRRAAGG